MCEDTHIKVAIRIRPQVSRELVDMCRICTSVSPDLPQVWLGKDKAFTFDHIFDRESVQEMIYDTCIQSLIEGCFDGYNATVLAYGQTGSGKTYTMGTGFDINLNIEEQGIIPRAVSHLFAAIKFRQEEALKDGKPPPQFNVFAQFIELYNEDIVDLLDPIDDKSKSHNIKIHEDTYGNITTSGLRTKEVQSSDETLDLLKSGALSRTTASTKMNSQSSRSHAIFTLSITQIKAIELGNTQDVETLKAKFHFVDLAGSERLKRTGATGDRAKEGISINCGLLALGNVISALGDKARKQTHVPYRVSKLTRLLQDSLGGNSRTLMIACVSPSDRDFMETLNTLRYANRAKNIKNKVIINQDTSSQTITALRNENQRLQLELLEYKQGKRVSTEDGLNQISDMSHENKLLQAELTNLYARVKVLQTTLDETVAKNVSLLAQMATGHMLQNGDGDKSDFSDLVHSYLKEIEDLRSKLLEAENMCSFLRKKSRQSSTTFTTPRTSSADIVKEARRNISKLEKKLKKMGSKADVTKVITSPDHENGISDEEVDEEDANCTTESSSLSDGEQEQDKSADDLAIIETEIAIKQKLIDELEESQKTLHTMKDHYESKLIALQAKITETEQERDKVLTGLKNKDKSEEVSKVKKGYEKKIKEMQTDLKKLKEAEKKHCQLMRHQKDYERKLTTLRNELLDMKKSKVQMMNKVKETNQKNAAINQKQNKEIGQLKKNCRMKDYAFKQSQSENKKKDFIIKRRTEEIIFLRKKCNPLSKKVAGRVLAKRKSGSEKLFSPKYGKLKWQNIEKEINNQILVKQDVMRVEKEMDSYIQEREKLSKLKEKFVKRKMRAIHEGKDESYIQQLIDEIENVTENINYLQENITEAQTAIVHMEETKEDLDNLCIVSYIPEEDTSYILQKLLKYAINQSLQVSQHQSTIRDLQTQVKELQDSDHIHQELLDHVLETSEVQPPEEMSTPIPVPIVTPKPETHEEDGFFFEIPNQIPMANKRRKTATSQELMSTTQKYFQDIIIEEEAERPLENTFIKEPCNKTILSPVVKRRNIFGEDSPSLRRKTMTSALFDNKPGNLEKRNLQKLKQRKSCRASQLFSINSEKNSSDKENGLGSPPSSPSLLKKNRDQNVFSRLTSGTSQSSNRVNVGMISSHKSSSNRPSPIICTHVAEGHSKAVLCVAATEEYMFTGSKDRTAKIWDLQSGRELMTLDGHPNNVVATKYSENLQLVFTVSNSAIHVWDIRRNPSNCIKILNSSGLSGTVPAKTSTLPGGENYVTDIALNHYGNVLYSAAGTIARIWDLRKFSSTGKLSSSHQAPITCLALDELNIDADTNHLVVTGSKDHYIKVFNVIEGEGGLYTPKITLEPPHYDGVESLAIVGDYLFSGSRDSCIKKWDLSTFNLVHNMNQAHKDWVYALCPIRETGLLLSGCRGGFLKLWTTDTCGLIGQVRAHTAPINAITSNTNFFFSASSDSSIGIWKIKATDYQSTANAKPDPIS